MVGLKNLLLAFCLWMHGEWNAWHQETFAVRTLQLEQGIVISQETEYEQLSRYHLFPRATTVFIANAKITCTVWNYLQRLRLLEYLKIQDCSFEDTVDVSFEHWRFLKDIDITGTRLHFDAIRSFARLPRLESICLYDVGASDEWLRQLMTIKKLRSVVIGRDKITDAGVQALISHARNLRELGLPDTQVTDEVAATVSQLEHLEVLDLSGTEITDKSLKQLCGLKHLRVLNLVGTPVTDKGISHLADHRTLQAMILDDTNITDHVLLYLDAIKSLDPEKVSVKGTKVNQGTFEQWRCKRAEERFRNRESLQKLKGRSLWLRGEYDRSSQAWNVSGTIVVENHSQSTCRLWMSELSVIATLRSVATAGRVVPYERRGNFYRLLGYVLGSDAEFYVRILFGPAFVWKDVNPQERLVIPVKFQASSDWKPQGKNEIIGLEVICNCPDRLVTTCCDCSIVMRVPVKALWIRENREWLMYCEE